MRLEAAVMIAAIIALALPTAAMQYGEQASDDAPKTTLDELLNAPDNYKDRTILVMGLFYGIDPDGDEFYFKGKTGIIEVAPPRDTKLITEVKPNTPIAVYGTVVVLHRGKQTSVRMVAKGVSVP